MIIRKAKSTDAEDLKVLSEIAKKMNCYKVFLETGSNKESTLNFYRNNGFVIDEKHSCLKKL